MVFTPDRLRLRRRAWTRSEPFRSADRRHRTRGGHRPRHRLPVVAARAVAATASTVGAGRSVRRSATWRRTPASGHGHPTFASRATRFARSPTREARSNSPGVEPHLGHDASPDLDRRLKALVESIDSHTAELIEGDARFAARRLASRRQQGAHVSARRVDDRERLVFAHQESELGTAQPHHVGAAFEQGCRHFTQVRS